MGDVEERNKAIVERVYREGYNGGDESVYAELYKPDFFHHSKVLHDVGQGGEAERQSMLRFRESMPDARFVFLAPPSFAELERRLVGRGTEGPEERERRLATARTELAAESEFDHVIVNDDVARATDELIATMGLPTR